MQSGGSRSSTSVYPSETPGCISDTSDIASHWELKKEIEAREAWRTFAKCLGRGQHRVGTGAVCVCSSVHTQHKVCVTN